MKEESLFMEGFSGVQHYTILSEHDIKELLSFGIICTNLGREDSYYIVTEECWNADFIKDIEKGETMKIIEVNTDVGKIVRDNGGYCPCLIEQNEDTLCPCKEFRDQPKAGPCNCGRFIKVED